MSENSKVWSRPGIGNVGSYQASGIPFMTGSAVPGSEGEVHVEFPLVTKSIKVASRSANTIRIHFNSLSDGNVSAGRHYWELDADNAELELSVKCKEIYISTPSAGGAGDFDLYAELTNIGAGEMFALTGSGLTD